MRQHALARWLTGLAMALGLLLGGEASAAADTGPSASAARTLEDRAAPLVLPNLGKEGGSWMLARSLDVLADGQGQWDIQAVSQGEAVALFRRATHREQHLSFGYTRAVYWLRWTVENPDPRDRALMLELANPLLAQVDLFLPAADGSYSVMATGVARPQSGKPYAHRHFVFPLNLVGGERQTAYLRVESVSPMQLPLTLWDRDRFHVAERNDYSVQAWYFGMATAMAVFNLLLFLALRDGVYLAYVAFVLASAATLAAYNGFLPTGWGVESPLLLSLIPNLGFCVSLLSLLHVMRKMLPTAALMPRLDRVLRGFMALLAVLPLALAMDLSRLIQPAAVIYLLTVLLVIGGGLLLSRQGHAGARLFLLAFLLPCLAGVATFARAIGLLPSTVWSLNVMQLASSFQMLLLAFALAERYRRILKEKAAAQQALVETEQLRVSNEALSRLNGDLERAYVVAEQSRAEATQALQSLGSAQAQLVQSEKMAVLGQLVAGVAHEVNTPIASIKASGSTMSDALAHALNRLPALLLVLSSGDRESFLHLLAHALTPQEVMGSSEERQQARLIMQKLEAAGVPQARHKAGLLVQLHARGDGGDVVDPADRGQATPGGLDCRSLLPLLQHSQADELLEVAADLARVAHGIQNINAAVDSVAKIVFALKSFTRQQMAHERELARIQDGLDLVLTIYKTQFKGGVELVREFEDMPPLWIRVDEMNQVWTNLIHNALQAMKFQGTLTVRLQARPEGAQVSISDTGGGIPPEILPRIFDVFFTTKPVGEGSGLGLDIVRRIVETHHGTIQVDSQPGVGSTFMVNLPWPQAPDPA